MWKYVKKEKEHVDRSPDCAFNTEGQLAASVA